jgi:hypothetical protein
MVFACLKAGFSQVWSNKRILFVFYLANLLFGVVLMLPFRATLDNFVGDSLMGERLAGSFDMNFLFEFMKNNSALGGIFFTGIIVLAGIYGLVNLFLSGGALSIFASKESFSAANFWGDSGKYFGRFVRLFLWGLPLLTVLFGLQFIVTGARRIIFGGDPYEYVLYWSKWIQLVLRWFSFFFFIVIFDYARIYTVKFDERKMLKSLGEGLRFAWKNLRRTITLAFTISLLGIIGLLIYNPVADLLSAPYVVIIILLFLWQQIFMLFRMLLRLGLYAGEVQLYHHLRPAAPDSTSKLSPP